METMTVSGGNTDTIYSVEDAHKIKSEALLEDHADVSKVVKRFNRVHHQVNYDVFKWKRLSLRSSASASDAAAALSNAYESDNGMIYVDYVDDRIYKSISDVVVSSMLVTQISDKRRNNKKEPSKQYTTVKTINDDSSVVKQKKASTKQNGFLDRHPLACSNHIKFQCGKDGCVRNSIITFNNGVIGRCMEHGGKEQILNETIKKITRQKRGAIDDTAASKAEAIKKIWYKYEYQQSKKCHFCSIEIELQMIINSNHQDYNHYDRFALLKIHGSSSSSSDSVINKSSSLECFGNNDAIVSTTNVADIIEEYCCCCEMCRSAFSHYCQPNVHHIVPIIEDTWKIIFSSGSFKLCRYSTISNKFINGHNTTKNVVKYLSRIANSVNAKHTQQQQQENVKQPPRWSIPSVSHLIYIQKGRCAITGAYFCFCDKSECPFKPTVEPIFTCHHHDDSTFFVSPFFAICQFIGLARGSQSKAHVSDMKSFVEALFNRKNQYDQNKMINIKSYTPSASAAVADINKTKQWNVVFDDIERRSSEFVKLITKERVDVTTTASMETNKIEAIVNEENIQTHYGDKYYLLRSKCLYFEVMEDLCLMYFFCSNSNYYQQQQQNQDNNNRLLMYTRNEYIKRSNELVLNSYKKRKTR